MYVVESSTLHPVFYYKHAKDVCSRLRFANLRFLKF